MDEDRLLAALEHKRPRTRLTGVISNMQVDPLSGYIATTSRVPEIAVRFIATGDLPDGEFDLGRASHFTVHVEAPGAFAARRSESDPLYYVAGGNGKLLVIDVNERDVTTVKYPGLRAWDRPTVMCASFTDGGVVVRYYSDSPHDILIKDGGGCEPWSFGVESSLWNEDIGNCRRTYIDDNHGRIIDSNGANVDIHYMEDVQRITKSANKQ